MLDKKYLIGGGILLVVMAIAVYYMSGLKENFDNGTPSATWIVTPPKDGSSYSIDKDNNIMPSYGGGNKITDNIAGGSVVIGGTENTITKKNSVACGNLNTCNARSAIVSGSGNVNNGDASFMSGMFNKSTENGVFSLTFGSRNNMDGVSSIIVGDNNTIGDPLDDWSTSAIIGSTGCKISKSTNVVMLGVKGVEASGESNKVYTSAINAKLPMQGSKSGDLYIKQMNIGGEMVNVVLSK